MRLLIGIYAHASSEILLFGTGLTTVPAPKGIRDYISGLGIQLDVMDSVGLFFALLLLE